MSEQLMDWHQRQLRESAIDDAVAAERGYQSVGRPTAGDGSSRDKLKRLGIPSWARDEDARYPGLLIPLYRATGELIAWQYRPDSPPSDPAKPGKKRKYANQAGHANVLDVHPRNRDKIIDPTVPLWVTEGVKKADSLTSRGLCAVALNGVFNWRSTLGTLGDWEDVVIKGRTCIVCFDADARENRNVQRAMQRLGKWLASKGARSVLYLLPPSWEYIDDSGLKQRAEPKGVDDYFAQGGTVDGLLAAMVTSPPAASADAVHDPEGIVVEVLVDGTLDDHWLYCPALGTGRGSTGWLQYKPGDGCWAPVPDAVLLEEIRAWLKETYLLMRQALAEAERDGDEKAVEVLSRVVGQWQQRLSRAAIANLGVLARGLLIAEVDDFDGYPHLLNCPNGVVDLRTGQLLAHDPALRFTQVAGARYVPGARHPDWDKALEAVPADRRSYLSLRLGQAVTGDPPPDDGVLVNIGKGENGKSTLTLAAERALGGYFRWISDRVVVGDQSQHPTEFMDFRGARLAVIEELPDESRLNLHAVKKITGSTITARYCGQDSAPYQTSHAFMINSNVIPLVTETDHGSWRRLIPLGWPFRYHKAAEFPAEPGEFDRYGEPGLRERLRAGDDGRAEAVLCWLVEWAGAWYAGQGERQPMTFGPEPEPVRTGRLDWRAAANPLVSFVTTRLEADPGAHIWVVEMRSEFSEKLRDDGHKAWSAPTLTARFPDVCAALGIRVTRVQAGVGRDSSGTVSRPPETYLAPLPAHYDAWHGVRYRPATEQEVPPAKPQVDRLDRLRLPNPLWKPETENAFSDHNFSGISSDQEPLSCLSGQVPVYPARSPAYPVEEPPPLSPENLAALAKLTVSEVAHCPDCTKNALCGRHRDSYGA